jgi:hypothetical protein
MLLLMPLTHHCISCGTDLSWIRAVPDPQYGLPIVVCPSCSTACTRRKPEILSAIRRFKLGLRTAVVLAVKLFMLALLLTMSMGILIGFADDTPTPSDAIGVLMYALTKQMNPGVENVSFVRSIDMIRTILLLLVLVSVGAGVWMRSAHGHIKLWISVLIWYALLLALISIAYTGNTIGLVLDGRRIDHLSASKELGALAVYLLSTLPFFFIGLPLGARARRIWEKQHAINKHKRRRKLRKHRMNHARTVSS